MNTKKRKAVIDDGMNPELVNGADFDGYYGIPVIKKPEEIIIPKSIVPFSKLGKADTFDDAIATYEMDQEFSDLLIHPDDHVEVLKRHIFISLDCRCIVMRLIRLRSLMFIVAEQLEVTISARVCM